MSCTVVEHRMIGSPIMTTQPRKHPTPERYALPKGGSAKVRTTVSQHLSGSDAFKDASLRAVVDCIQGTCKKLSGLVKQTNITWSHGNPGSVRWNQLQDVAEDLMQRSILACPWVCAAVSPLHETLMKPTTPHPKGEYVVCWDALDGTSNLHAGVNTGTIFGIYRRISPVGTEAVVQDALQCPSDLLCAGYAMYAAGTRLILAAGGIADCFVLDDELGHFVLSARKLKVPEGCNSYSVNEGNNEYWDEPTRQLVGEIKGRKRPDDAPLKLRYVGTMVADVHRTLVHGGLFMYPADARSPLGKLRLLYEAGPMAYVFSCAGGMSTSGAQDILAAQPSTLHQRTPLFLGSCGEVALAQRVYAAEVREMLDNVSAERQWISHQRLQLGSHMCSSPGEGGGARRIFVPDDYATLPEAIAACAGIWQRELESKGAQAKAPHVTLRRGLHAWNGTMQVKPGTIVVIEGEDGAHTKGHWWLPAGSGGAIRRISCECEESHGMTAYGGCWTLEDVVIECVSARGVTLGIDEDEFDECVGTGRRGGPGGFEAVQTFGQSHLTLKRCTLGGGGGCTVGVFAYSNSCCRLEGCIIKGPAEQCIYVGNNAVVTLNDCRLEGGMGRREGLAMLVEHSGAVLLKGCDMVSCIGISAAPGGDTVVLLEGNTVRKCQGVWSPPGVRPHRYAELGTRTVLKDKTGVSETG